MNGFRRQIRAIRSPARAKDLLLYSDRAVIVLNKPPGLVCQLQNTDADDPTTSEFDTLLEDVQNHFEMPNRPFPVHRLDKGTTGALFLARDAAFAREMSRQLQNKTIGKTYLALVDTTSNPLAEKRGEIRSPIAYNDGRAYIGIGIEAKAAATDWELLASSKESSVALLRLRLLTGLKHQLRVHLSHVLQTPVLGDRLHGRTNSRGSSRMFLHASHLSIPRFKKQGPHKLISLGIRAPLPSDFVDLCTTYGIPLSNEDKYGGMFAGGKLVEENVLPALDGQWHIPVNTASNNTEHNSQDSTQPT